MRTGAYDSGESDVDVKQSFYGPLSILVNEEVAKANAIKGFQDASNKSFAAVVDRAIKEYRRRKTSWQEPNTCAQLTFSPASGSLKLDTGDTGRVVGEVEASRGGRASGRWRLVGRKNLTIAPATADGKEPAFQYRVTRGGSKIAVSASFRATSKAGVAKGTWEQNGNDRPQAWVGTITGRNNHTCCSENVQTTWTAPILFKLTYVSNPPPGIEQYWHYDALSGRVNWNTAGKSGPCTVRGSGSTPIVKIGAPNYGKLVIGSLDLHQLGSRYWYTTVVTGVPSESSPVQQSGCEGGGLIKRSFFKFTLVLVPPERSMRRDDQTLSGSSTYRSGGGTETYTWQLKAVK